MNKGPYAVRGIIGVILIVAIAVAISESNSRARSQSGTTIQTDRLEATAVLGPNHQRVASMPRYSEATAFMGNVQLDLSDAKIEGNEATMEVTALMGAVELRVPSTWTVAKHDLTTIMGNVEDRTRPSAEEGNKRLVITGTVMMGKLEIRN